MNNEKCEVPLVCNRLGPNFGKCQKCGRPVAEHRVADHAAEIERLSKQRDEWKKLYEQNERTLTRKDCKQCHGSGEIVDSEEGGMMAKCHCWAAYATELQKRAEAAESKLSQLQLSNEEKAKKIAEQFDKWDEAGMWPEDSCEVEKRILAILNGGQQ